VLADAPATTHSAGAGTVTQKDLLTLMGALDSTYAAADTAGFVMNWKTFIAILSDNMTDGTSDGVYLLRQDGAGHWLLHGRPVFISPSMPDVATSAVPVLYGDWSRLLIRNVPTEAVLLRYEELYMANHQVGYEMLFRADAKIVHAGGAGDNPILGLTVA
jgi:HK97 family phage major capsid protein